MAKLDDYRELLKEHIGETFTTKYLLDTFGITSWYIGELTHIGVLDKEKRGVYRVLDFVKKEELPNEPRKSSSKKVIIVDNKNKNEVPQKEFKIFKDLVLANKFEEAYEALIRCVEANKDNHDYDNHYRMYFIMLTRILKSKGAKIKLDYNYEDKLLEFYDSARTAYFANYVSFREALLSGKFREANDYLREYANKEYIRNNGNKISTVLSKHLLNQIMCLEDNQRMTSKKFIEINNNIHGGNYEETLYLIQELHPYLNTSISIKLAKYMEDLCKTIIEFKNNPHLLLEEKTDYEFNGGESLAKVFSAFMNNKDYINAYAYINICCEKYKGNFFDTIKRLLNNLININKRHLVNSPNQRELNAKRLETKKSEAEMHIHFSRFLTAMQHLDFDVALDEITQNLCHQSDPSSSIYLRSKNIYNLLKFYKDFKEQKVELIEPYKIYLDFDNDYFNFTKALMHNDWITADKYYKRMDIGTSLTLEACGLILKAILRQDKINKGIPLTPEDELKPLSSHINQNLSSPISNSLEAPLNLPKDNPKEEIKEDKILKMPNYEEITKEDIFARIKNLTLNYETLYKLVKNREFEEAYELISKEEKNGYNLEEELVKMAKSEETKEETNEVKDEIKEDIASEENIQEEILEEPIIEEEKNPPKLSHKEEVLESIKDLSLNYDTLYNLVYERDYEKALYLLERENDTSRLFFNAHRLISQYLHVIKGRFKLPEQKPYDYTQDCFKLFFASLNNRDYEYSLEVIDDCIEKARNSEEFELFKLIIIDIVNELRNTAEEKREKEEKEQKLREVNEEISNINKQVFSLSNKQELDASDLYILQNLLGRKVDLSINNELNYEKDELVLGAIEAAIMSIDGSLNDNCFANINDPNIDDALVKASVDLSSSKPEDIFYVALKNGDILTAGNILMKINWDNLRDKLSSTNLRLLKKSFIFMKEHMRFIVDKEDKRSEIASQKVPQEVLDEIEKSAYEILDEEGKKDYHRMQLLKNLYSLVKHQKYNEAIGLILESDANIKDSEGFISIIGDILEAKVEVTEESHALFDEFNQAMESKDPKSAMKAFLAYSGYLTSKSIERDLTYHRKRIDILERDLKSPNFEEKEKIYLDALAMLHNREIYNNVEKAIEIINRYIELDKDINTKGYLLRARAYEILNRDKEARDDYKKSLDIAPTPNAYYALGKYAFAREDYSRAITYLESYHAIRPFKCPEASRMLAICYNSTKNKEASIPHNKYLSYVSNIKH